MPLIEVPHGRLYYEAHGQGSCVVLLHGMWSNHGSWRKVAPELAKTHRVVLLDHMGHGKSDRLRVPYRLPTYASDLEALLNHIGAEKVSLVGFSMGALIAQEYYFLRPSRVASLVLIAAPPPYRFRWRVGVALVSLLERLGVTSVKKESIRAMARRQSASGDRALIDRSLRDLASYDDDEFTRIVRSVWDKGGTGRQGEIRVPTLIIVGEKDSIRRHSVYLRRAVPHSRLVTVPDSDHSVLLTRPDILAGEITKFLTDVDAAGEPACPSS